MSYDSSLRALRLRHLHSQPDEGYSEDVHSQAGSELEDFTSKPLSESAKVILRSLDALTSDERIDVVRLATDTFSQADQLLLLKDTLFNLPTWAKQDIASHLDSLMFFDPVEYFPYELVQTVFSHLSPKDLLSASAVNHTWRAHTQDEELWRVCFKREGWQVDSTRLEALEAASEFESASPHHRDSRKRRRAEAFDISPERVEGDDVMDGIEDTLSMRSISASPNALKSKGRRRYSTQSTLSSRSSILDAGLRLRPLLMQHDGSGNPRVSWAYLYKQRRMLERNWERGKYQQFRLPHPKHPEEGHAECVYTIQHIGSVLVSGSRDRTIRRWNLDTCRLKGEPLKGHAASVLCLQFDPSPGNDLIVSGGSDSWVIIWRYSTGEIIKKMTTAHTESVLNLRFDDRYIVTCSKDKTIKIWNRRALSKEDPMFPAHVIPQYGSTTMGAPMVEEYSLLTQLLGHHAAVNAVMIHADRIVSASGDRHIKAWSIQSGKCERTYTGHTKCIACVQYDGRRIISGSSDNTVRIFDAEQQAEVACLQGHSNLVRTVQARFGDLQVTSDDELLLETRQADAKWRQAMNQGVPQASGSRRGLRNAGSSNPEDMLTIGAKIPPGGGGTKWARIVSGSYDETVIIWRKDDEGKWVAKHKLQQEMLRPRPRGPRLDPPHASSLVRFLPQSSRIADTPQQSHQDHSHPNLTAVQTTITAGPATVAQVHQHSDTQNILPQGVPLHLPIPHVPVNAPMPDPAAVARPRPTVQQFPDPSTRPHTDAARLDSNRIFKLQFDVRRIVCCSQNKIIMGWDFAAGNEELGRVGNLCEETY